MSDAKVERTLSGVYYQLSSASSSLHMYPETMEVTTDDMFLDETDVWANHSSKHIHAAIQSLTKWHKGVMRKALFVLRQADLTREQRTKICFLIRRILEN